MVYYVRKAALNDLSEILAVFVNARQNLKKQNIQQWQNKTGPNKEMTIDAINLGEAYVLIEDRDVMGFGTITTKKQASYETLIGGTWTSSDKYVSIHSFAVHSNVKQRGLGFLLLSHLISNSVALGYRDIRIDTHPNNKRMQQVILKAGFSERGSVFLTIENGERYAYQLMIETDQASTKESV